MTWTKERVEEIFFKNLGMTKEELAHQLVSPDAFERDWAFNWLNSYKGWMEEYANE